MSKIEFTLGNERIIPTAGIAAVGAILGNAGFTSHFNKTDVTTRRSGRQIKNGDSRVFPAPIKAAMDMHLCMPTWVGKDT